MKHLIIFWFYAMFGAALNKFFFSDMATGAQIIAFAFGLTCFGFFDEVKGWRWI